MANYTRIRNTIMSNPDGVLDSVLSYGLQERVKSNTRLYFYKYDVKDLVEIKFESNMVCVYDFKHTEDKAVIIRDDLEFYAGYFESAGLANKRFLFDLGTRMPANYDDFIEKDFLNCVNNKEFAFVLDKKSGYITERRAVNVFLVTGRTENVDKCIISYVNNSIKTLNPRHLEFYGCANSIIISGLLNGVLPVSIEDELDTIDLDAKFTGTINSLNFSSSHINSINIKLKVDKFKRILEKSKPDDIINAEVVEKSKDNVSLREIVDKGLDRFIKAIKVPKDVIKVEIDCETQTIRSAYIVKGNMFITPVTLKPISYFKELLNSDNVEYILN